MKRMICLILIAVIIVLPGCNKDNTAENSQPKMQYTIYYDSALATSDANTAGGANCEISFENVSYKDFDHSQQTALDDTSAVAQKTLEVGGTQYQLSLDMSYETSLASSELASLRPYGLFDEYVAIQADPSGRTARAEFRHDTGELLFFSSGGTPSTDGDLTEETARELAAAQLIELYGAETASKYTFTDTVVTDTAEQKHIGVIYTRHICGYPTTDQIQFMYSMQGELSKVYAVNLGMFDPIESNITTEKINDAESAFESAFSTPRNITKTTLVLEAQGVCYLRVYGSQEIDGNFVPLVYYINID